MDRVDRLVAETQDAKALSARRRAARSLFRYLKKYVSIY
jgi:hypothetical protein